MDICSTIRRIALPQHCLLCAGPAVDQAICTACRTDLPWHGTPACPVCALSTPGGSVCGACLKHAPAFDTTLAALDYRFPLDVVLQRYKYGGGLEIALAVGELLSSAAARAAKPELILPMPLHDERLRERGFNQALEIARVVARRLHIPLDRRSCRRVRATRQQAGLSLEERRRNMRGAFACDTRLDGRHVVLLDDVMTSGASLNALAVAVRKAGAARIDCWVVARTPKD